MSRGASDLPLPAFLSPVPTPLSLPHSVLPPVLTTWGTPWLPITLLPQAPLLLYGWSQYLRGQRWVQFAVCTRLWVVASLCVSCPRAKCLPLASLADQWGLWDRLSFTTALVRSCHRGNPT